MQDTSRTVSGLTERELEVGEDGRFEVTLSPDPKPGNWIRTEPDVNLVLLRKYSDDWSHTEEGTFAIERIPAAPPAAPLGETEIRGGLRREALA